MYCSKCGNQIAEGASFCAFCGFKAPEQVAPVQSEVVSAPPVTQAPPVTETITPIQPEAPQATYSTEQEIPRMAPNFGAPVPVVKEKKPKEEKYYTFGHIMLCLSAVAVMAIVAGVFAGLYFSVV